MARFVLPSGHVVLIDDADLPIMISSKWYADRRTNTVYVSSERNGRKVYLHNFITGNKRSDHKDGNGLNNQRANLRSCTQAQNSLNSAKKRPYKRFKSVYFDNRRGLWYSQIYADGKSFFGGYHRTAEDAARAYDRLAITLHKEFARLNFPEEIL